MQRPSFNLLNAGMSKPLTGQRVNYAGGTGDLFTQGEQCGFIVELCVLK